MFSLRAGVCFLAADILGAVAGFYAVIFAHRTDGGEGRLAPGTPPSPRGSRWVRRKSRWGGGGRAAYPGRGRALGLEVVPPVAVSPIEVAVRAEGRGEEEGGGLAHVLSASSRGLWIGFLV